MTCFPAIFLGLVELVDFEHPTIQGLQTTNTQYGSAPALPCYMPSLQDLYNTGYNLLD